MASPRTTLLALSLTALAPSAARSDTPLDIPLRIGLFGGWHATADDYDVLGERRRDFVPGAGPMFGLRLGYRLSADFALELESGVVVAPAGDGSALLLPNRIAALWRPLPGDISPLVGLGAGFVANAGGPGSGDVDLLLAATAGVELRVHERVALRLEAGVMASDAVSGAMSWTPVVTLGVDLLGFRGKRTGGLIGPKPPRPQTPAHGCPPGVPDERCIDSDEDRLIDAFDRCPTQPASRSDGCPDPDQDGIVEPRDACPDVRGRASEWGCPAPIRPAAPR